MEWRNKTAALVGSLMVSALGGCGSVAGPLSHSGVERPSAGQVPAAADTAWFVCFRGQYQELPADVHVLVRYKHCQIVLTEGPQHEEMRIMAELLLGPAERLAVVDAGLLLKAMVEMSALHLVVRVVPDSEGDVDLDLDRGSLFHEEVACYSRSKIATQHDLDCPLSALPILLARDDIESIAVHNRHWVRWR